MKKIMVILLAVGALQVRAQTNIIGLSPLLKISGKDSSEAVLLRACLYQLLADVKSGSYQNSKFIYPDQRVETLLLLQAIEESEKSEKKTGRFTPYLIGLTAFDGHKYLLNISFLGTAQNTAVCQAAFTLVAYKINGRYVFTSPLKRVTADWKIHKSGEFTFFYKFKLNESKVKEYIKWAMMIDKKMQSSNKITEIYMCDDFAESQRLVGIDYQASLQGNRYGIFQTVFLNKIIVVRGDREPYFDDFDTRDVWNERLGLVQPLDKVNQSISEGCAYLYGTRWGFNWMDIFKIFKEKVASEKNISWKGVKEKPLNFWVSEEKPLYADYVVNGLLVQKIEKEKGFASVLEWMTNVSTEGYYQALEKLTGISAANYNEKIAELIEQVKTDKK